MLGEQLGQDQTSFDASICGGHLSHVQSSAVNLLYCGFVLFKILNSPPGSQFLGFLDKGEEIDDV